MAEYIRRLPDGRQIVFDEDPDHKGDGGTQAVQDAATSGAGSHPYAPGRPELGGDANATS